MKKRTRQLEFSPQTRKIIRQRDRNECVFCELRYHMEDATWLGCSTQNIMHYIPRSQGGLGIEQNGVLGCQYHHDMMDNGNKGLRKEMLGILRGYLMGNYPGWNEEDLVYNKWR